MNVQKNIVGSLFVLCVFGMFGLPNCKAQTVTVFGDSFASNFDNTVGPFDWPILLQQQFNLNVELFASPGQRLAVSHAPIAQSVFPQSNGDVLVVASGLNDFLNNFADISPLGGFNEPAFDPFFAPNNADVFTTLQSQNAFAILTKRIVDQWRLDRPGRPIILFNIPPFEQFILDQGGSVNAPRLLRAQLYNQWLAEYVSENEDITLFDIRSFLENRGDFFAEELPDPRLHPDAESQQALAVEINGLVASLVEAPGEAPAVEVTSVPEPSTGIVSLLVLQMLVMRRRRRSA